MGIHKASCVWMKPGRNQRRKKATNLWQIETARETWWILNGGNTHANRLHKIRCQSLNNCRQETEWLAGNEFTRVVYSQNWTPLFCRGFVPNRAKNYENRLEILGTSMFTNKMTIRLLYTAFDWVWESEMERVLLNRVKSSTIAGSVNKPNVFSCESLNGSMNKSLLNLQSGN